MFKRTLLTLAVLAMAGCASNSASTPSADADKAAVARPTPEELAAYAGHATFPTTQPAQSDLQLASIVGADKSSIKIYNFTNKDLRNIDIWVNGSYVQHVGGIAPQSSVVIQTSELYNGLGKNLAGQGEPISRVQISTDHGLFNVWGPASD
jgi:hypothetical protein